jgi:cytoskeletal protein CcmA (bactofilin family)
MCKRCGRHVDLRDYEINQAVSKNFRTHGRFVIEAKGNVFNTEAVVGDAVIKGKFLGKLNAWRTLTILSGAQIKGTIQTGCLIIPEGNQFRWPELTVERAEISGELVSTFKACGTVLLKATAVLFGDVEATNLVIEPGAVWVGDARIGQPSSTKAPGPQPEPEPKPEPKPESKREPGPGSNTEPATKPRTTRSKAAKPKAAKSKAATPKTATSAGNSKQQELMP